MARPFPAMKELVGHRFTLLLASLVFLLVIAPLTEGTGAGSTLFTLGLTTVFVTGVSCNRQRVWIFRFGVAIAAVAIPVSWTAMFNKSAEVDLTQYLIVVVFSAATAVLILTSVLLDDMETKYAVVGAICVYLLIGLTWAMVYTAIEYVEDEPFNFADPPRTSIVGVEHTSFAQFTYFSFVTMSTLGYGDISPRTALSETACWTQSVVGEMYVAILIARLVSELGGRRRREKEDE